MLDRAYATASLHKIELTGAPAVAAHRRRSVEVGVDLDVELHLLRLHHAQVSLLQCVRLRWRDARLEEEALVLELALDALFHLFLLPRRPLEDDALEELLLPRWEGVLGSDDASARRRIGHGLLRLPLHRNEPRARCARG